MSRHISITTLCLLLPVFGLFSAQRAAQVFSKAAVVAAPSPTFLPSLEESTVIVPYVPDGPFPVRWARSWTIDWHSYTNRPAAFTGMCITDFSSNNVVELVTFEVDYYERARLMTNSFGQTYWTMKVKTNDLEYSASVLTTNKCGMIGAFTR